MEALRDLEYEPGDRVRVTEGPFRNLIGVVYEVDNEHDEVRITISFFGRPTPLVLDRSRVTKV
jgi:transcriptional antiterminator NusG